MNVLYHHRTQGKGVEGVHIQGIVNGLTELGCQVDIISPAGVSVEQAFSAQHSTRVGKVLKLLSRYLPEFLFECLECLYNFSASRNLNRQLALKKYDFIFERYAFLTWSGISCARKAGIPYIVEVNFTSHVPLVRKRSIFFRWLQVAIERNIYKNADGIVVVSAFLKNQLLEIGISAEKIIMLTNAAEPRILETMRADEELANKFDLTGKTVLGFVGGFYPWHGLDFLLAALDIVVKKRQNIAILLIGDGPERTPLGNRIKGTKLQDVVHFVGAVDHEELPKYLSLFDIALLPDTNNYGSPMKIFEYMAMGKPVIAPRLGPVEDGIKDGEEGVLFESGDKNCFADAILLLLSDKERIKLIGQKGRKKIENKHNWIENSRMILSQFNNIKN